jgi:hypothetical protein
MVGREARSSRQRGAWAVTDQPPARRRTAAGPHLQRAPRLRPDQHLADSMTRVGRFAAIDPLQGRKLPKLIHVLGVVGWAALVGEAFRRARAASED